MVDDATIAKRVSLCAQIEGFIISVVGIAIVAIGYCIIRHRDIVWGNVVALAGSLIFFFVYNASLDSRRDRCVALHRFLAC